MNKQNKHYQQLTQEPRYQISGLRKAGMSLRAIAAEVGVHSSTVSRELRRNASEGGYDPGIAHQSYYAPSSHTTLQKEATSILTQGGAVIVR
jgi:IS30 family transposase